MQTSSFCNGTIRCRVHALLVQGHQPSRNSVLASVKASKHPNQWDKNRNHLRGADEFLGHWKLLTWANTKESCQTECRTRWYCTFGFQINSKSLLELSLCQILYVPNMGHTYKNLFIIRLKLKSWASYVFNCEIRNPNTNGRFLPVHYGLPARNAVPSPCTCSNHAPPIGLRSHLSYSTCLLLTSCTHGIVSLVWTPMTYFQQHEPTCTTLLWHSQIIS